MADEDLNVPFAGEVVRESRGFGKNDAIIGLDCPDDVAPARELGLQIDVLNASSEREIDAALASLAGSRTGGLVIAGDGVFVNRSEQLAAPSLRHATPAIFQYHEFVAAGGIMSYGASLAEISRLVGVYTGRVITGEKPADLPVVQPTKFELVINLKSTKALGIEVPPTLLALADEAIE